MTASVLKQDPNTKRFKTKVCLGNPSWGLLAVGGACRDQTMSCDGLTNGAGVGGGGATSLLQNTIEADVVLPKNGSRRERTASDACGGRLPGLLHVPASLPPQKLTHLPPLPPTPPPPPPTPPYPPVHPPTLVNMVLNVHRNRKAY